MAKIVIALLQKINVAIIFIEELRYNFDFNTKIEYESLAVFQADIKNVAPLKLMEA